MSGVFCSFCSFFPGKVKAEGDQVDENVDEKFDEMEVDGNFFEGDNIFDDDEVHPSDVSSDQADQSGSGSDPQGKSPI